MVLNPRQERLAGEQQQHKRERENPVFEDQPGDAQPLPIARQRPRQNREAERDHDREANDPESDEHLAVLGGEPHNPFGGFFGALEDHLFQRRRVR